MEGKQNTAFIGAYMRRLPALVRASYILCILFDKSLGLKVATKERGVLDKRDLSAYMHVCEVAPSLPRRQLEVYHFLDVGITE